MTRGAIAAGTAFALVSSMSDQAPGLRRGAIGLREVLFQSVASMAPAGSVGFSLILGAKYAGGALSLSVLIALLPCLSIALSLAEMARHMPSAGAFFTFPSRALHPAAGFLAAWAYIYICASSSGVLAVLLALQLRGALGLAPGLATWAISAAAVVLSLVAVWALSVRGVRSSAKAGTWVGLTETAVLCALALVLLYLHRGSASIEPFLPRSADVKGFEGWSGIIAGAVYATLAFQGFEAAAPLAEEARDPARTVPRAVILSCLFGAGVYLLTTYAATLALGGPAFSRFTVTDEGSHWLPLARSTWAPFGPLLSLAFLSSLLGGQNAAFNALTRTWFSMGRSGVLPAALARTHPIHGSPHVAAAVQLAVSLLVAGLAIPFGATAVVELNATASAALVIALYVLLNLSCIAFFLREQRKELRPWLHVAVPLLGIAGMVPAFFVSLGITSRWMPFVTPLSGPAALAGVLILAWMLLGVGVLGVVAWRRPAELARGGAALTGAP